MSLDIRKVHVYRDDAWIEAKMQDLKTGDTFTLQESDGEPVVYQGSPAMIATSDPFLQDGVWAVGVEALLKYPLLMPS